MERSIADQLYSDISKPSNIESDERAPPSSIVSDCDGDDLWYDEEGCDKTEKLENAFDTDMDREWQKRREQFHTIGYRDGLMAGKEASAQQGFNIGFKESVFVGQRWGLVRGVTSALASLPDGLKERLVGKEEQKNKFRQLHESVRALSTKDTLKLFHNGLKDKLTDEQGENAQINLPTEVLHGQGSHENAFENYVRDFRLLIRDSSGIKVHLENDQ